MHYPARLFGALLAHDAQRILGRFASMDNQWFLAFAGSPDMGPEPLALPLEVPFEPVVVKAGFPDRHDLRMLRECNKFRDRHRSDAFIVGVDAHRGINVGIGLGKPAHAREILERDGHAQRGLDAVFPHEVEHRIQLVGQFGEIDMAMRINEHSSPKGLRHAAGPRKK